MTDKPPEPCNTCKWQGGWFTTPVEDEAAMKNETDSPPKPLTEEEWDRWWLDKGSSLKGYILIGAEVDFLREQYRSLQTRVANNEE